MSMLPYHPNMPKVTLSWTSAQGSAPKYPTIMNIN